MTFCADCGHPLPPEIAHCADCGAPVAGTDAASVATSTSDTWQPVALGTMLRTELGQYVRQRVPLILFSFGVTWFLHTYLLVVKNEGFNPSTGIAGWINVSGNTASAMVIWIAGSTLFWSLVLASLKVGPIRAVRNLLIGPLYMVRVLVNARTRGLSSAGVGSALALIVSALLPINNQANLSLAVLWVFTAFSWPGRLLAEAILRVWIRLLQTVSAEILQQRAITPNDVQLLIVGVAPGFLLAALLPPAAALLVAVILVAGIVWYNARTSGALGMLGGLLVVGSVMTLGYTLVTALFPRAVLADDGGWQEAGGTFRGWWESPGRNRALVSGVPPAFGASLGPLVPPFGELVDTRPSRWDPPRRKPDKPIGPSPSPSPSPEPSPEPTPVASPSPEPPPPPSPSPEPSASPPPSPESAPDESLSPEPGASPPSSEGSMQDESPSPDPSASPPSSEPTPAEPPSPDPSGSPPSAEEPTLDESPSSDPGASPPSSEEPALDESPASDQSESPSSEDSTPDESPSPEPGSSPSSEEPAPDESPSPDPGASPSSEGQTPAESPSSDSDASPPSSEEPASDESPSPKPSPSPPPPPEPTPDASPGASSTPTPEEVARREQERQDKLRRLRERQKQLEREAATARRSASWWSWATTGVELVQTAADLSVDVLSEVTGPQGKLVKKVYTVAKGTAGGLGEAVAKGDDYIAGTLRGTGKGLIDLGFSQAKGKLMDKVDVKYPLTKNPLIKKYDPGVDWSKARVGFVRDALKGRGVQSSVSNMMRDRFGTAAKATAQSKVHSYVENRIKDPIKSTLD